MGSIFKPKMPAPPVFIQPDPEKVPEMDSAEDKARLAEEMRVAENKRTGGRSTILTGTGLNDIEDENIEKKTLLG
tara:strand:+ start:4255 stop:4479 length:225 start_codon:yes stop_codon:yes gene_type:complete